MDHFRREKAASIIFRSGEKRLMFQEKTAQGSSRHQGCSSRDTRPRSYLDSLADPYPQPQPHTSIRASSHPSVYPSKPRRHDNLYKYVGSILTGTIQGHLGHADCTTSHTNVADLRRLKRAGKVYTVSSTLVRQFDALIGHGDLAFKAHALLESFQSGSSIFRTCLTFVVIHCQ